MTSSCESSFKERARIERVGAAAAELVDGVVAWARRRVCERDREGCAEELVGELVQGLVDVGQGCQPRSSLKVLSRPLRGNSPYEWTRKGAH